MTPWHHNPEDYNPNYNQIPIQSSSWRQQILTLNRGKQMDKIKRMITGL
jgi:hypothetical protein